MVPGRIGIWKCCFLRRGENRSTRRKTSRSKGENQQQTQPTYGVDAGIWTRATLVGGERSHHCAIPCSPFTCGNPCLTQSKNRRNVFLRSSRATCKDEVIKPSNARLHLPPNTFGLGRFCTIKDVNKCVECNDTAIFTVNVLQKKGKPALTL